MEAPSSSSIGWGFWTHAPKDIFDDVLSPNCLPTTTGLHTSATCILQGFWWNWKTCPFVFRVWIPSVSVGKNFESIAWALMFLYIWSGREGSDDWGCGYFINNLTSSSPFYGPSSYLIAKCSVMELYRFSDEFARAYASSSQRFSTLRWRKCLTLKGKYKCWFETSWYW